MSFWDTITGSDLTREWKGFAARVEQLPTEYQAAWGEIVAHMFPFGDFTGRNLIAILDGVLGLLELSHAEGQAIEEVLGDDIPGFCAAVAGGDAARTYRDRWRDQLNRTVARKLAQAGD
jgi:DNA-binding ferritin-like protein (Dps family)